MKRPRALRLLRALAVAIAVLGAGLAIPQPVASAAPQETQADNPFERGPDPTEEALEAPQGPFEISQVTVPSQGNFAGGTIYYPNDTSEGTFGAVVVAPGWTESQAFIAWTGPRIASHGFVVFTIDMLNTFFDFPTARAMQMQAALDYLAQNSAPEVRQRLDASRLGVAGHSMGGGGSLEAVRENAELQAAVAFQPWDLGQTFNAVQVPSMIIGAQFDFVAPVAQHSEPYYEQIPAEAEKAYAELAGTDHFLGTQANVTQAKLTISWFKRYIDNDTRYEQFLCPAPSGSEFVEYRDSCPG